MRVIKSISNWLEVERRLIIIILMNLGEGKKNYWERNEIKMSYLKQGISEKFNFSLPLLVGDHDYRNGFFIWTNFIKLISARVNLIIFSSP